MRYHEVFSVWNTAPSAQVTVEATVLLSVWMPPAPYVGASDVKSQAVLPWMFRWWLAYTVGPQADGALSIPVNRKSRVQKNKTRTWCWRYSGIRLCIFQQSTPWQYRYYRIFRMRCLVGLWSWATAVRDRSYIYGERGTHYTLEIVTLLGFARHSSSSVL